MKIKTTTFHSPVYQKNSQDSSLLHAHKHGNSLVGKKNFSSVFHHLKTEKLELDLSEKNGHHKPWWSSELKNAITFEHDRIVHDPSTIEINSIKLTDILKAFSKNNHYLKAKLI